MRANAWDFRVTTKDGGRLVHNEVRETLEPYSSKTFLTLTEEYPRPHYLISCEMVCKQPGNSVMLHHSGIGLLDL